MKFKLHDFIKGNVSKVVIKTAKDRKNWTSTFFTFEVGEVYETNDKILIACIKGEKTDISNKAVYTEELKSILETEGVSYEKRESCSTCSNARPWLVYNPFKIIEE